MLYRESVALDELVSRFNLRHNSGLKFDSVSLITDNLIIITYLQQMSRETNQRVLGRSRCASRASAFWSGRMENENHESFMVKVSRVT
jgi:hypothetical protein